MTGEMWIVLGWGVTTLAICIIAFVVFMVNDRKEGKKFRK